MRFIDISGKVFGRLTLLERRGTYYLCQCTCGKTAVIYRGNLTSGTTKSCGCLQRESSSKRIVELNKKKRDCYPTITVSDQEFKDLIVRYRSYERNARKASKVFKISLEEFKSITEKKCTYCGIDKHIGIDRVDSLKGYTKSNIVPCCTICNRAKNALTLETFKTWIVTVYNHLKGKETQ